MELNGHRAFSENGIAFEWIYHADTHLLKFDYKNECFEIDAPVVGKIDSGLLYIYDIFASWRIDDFIEKMEFDRKWENIC